MKKFKIKNPLRLSLQGAIVILLMYMLAKWGLSDTYVPDFEAYCPFGGLQALSSYLVRGSLACTMTSVQIIMGLTLLVGVVLFSKLFCGYICPLGIFSEWFGKIGAKFKVRRDITGIYDKALRSLKYILLFITFYFTLGSSELFCKNYDPFFATFTLFNVDVTIWMAILSIVILIGGSIFFRLFWCKYLCPLGAISNIFKFFFAFIGVMGIYLLLFFVFNVELSYVWPLAAITILAYVLEVTRLKSTIFPLLKITRNEDACNSCQLCTKSCPQGIKVAELEKVEHVDCNLCTECLQVCNQDGALNLNKKKNLKWLPAILVVILVAVGVYVGLTFRVATINLRWAEDVAFENAEIYNRAGIKNIKCYGSSMAFARQMREVKGTLGVEAYTDDKSVKIYYDPKIITEDKITEMIFSTSKVVINKPKTGVEIQVVQLGLLGFFDQFDAYYLKQLLSQYGDIYGFDTKWGEPVETNIYFNANKEVNLDELVDFIESKTLTYSVNDFENTVSLSFEIRGVERLPQTISTVDFGRRTYPNYFKNFNKRDQYLNGELGIIEVEYEFFENATVWLAYMQNHVSKQDTGVVALHSKLDGENPTIQFDYVKEITNPEKIKEMIERDSLLIHFRTGKIESFANPFIFIKEDSLVNN